MSAPFDDNKTVRPPVDKEDDATTRSAEVTEQLVMLGRDQGFVTYDDVLNAFPEAEANMEQLEDLFANLFEQGIEVSAFRRKKRRGDV